ncbi:related to ERG28 Protein involved in synthesis of ergosterol [Ramularia collo-cygni]|uniref:Related to ERG28 Protein involved in synthesis of ergosterol n=1 Tax=Ramularia collo-cygni TaxID=112498 RepID=A0A2D3UY97_9PEZI|nr:related to ERG28 Protein involved in synthesis of ergosterol [Ramularia collo-cygni]CZT19335.1 related to ERG28 Protein involved in synthesis of ergosterol [Ramularia collo-cygni]
MSSLSSYLPPSEGLLPKWLLFIAIVSIGNSIQCYISLDGSRAVYTGTDNNKKKPSPKKTSPNPKPSESTSSSPVNALSARTFGTWTALSSIVRMYAAYNINNPQVYEICLWTYGIAFAHFFSEWLVFGSARWGKGLGSPVAVSTVTTVWMLSQWGYYVR